MSKKILAIGLTIVGIVLAIPTVGASLGLSALAIGAIEIGIAITESVLLGPAKPKVPKADPSGRLYASLVPTTPRKIWFGNTAGATDVRYQTFTGSKQDTEWLVVAHASHQVQSIDEYWNDNEKAFTSGGGALGRYASYLTGTLRLVGTSANGVAIDSNWTANSTLTGCAYSVFSYKLTGNSNNAQSPFQGGVSSRMTIRGKGALTYDPRLDSTVTGGSGSMRAATQSTWAWDDNASRNPAIQLLWYLLGWKINGKLAVGMGLPAARIDLPSFITAANICDETITLNGGGTEPRYRFDGVLAEDEDRRTVVETLCAHMNAMLVDAGGKLSLNVLHNDLASPVAAFTEADILEGGKWSQTPALADCFNIVRGRRTDPSDAALYQPVDYPEVSLTSNDGIDRIDTADYLFCQSNGQAQRLAKQRLQRNQYQGRYEFTGGERWLQTNIWDVVTLSHASYGWSAKLFRVVGLSIDLHKGQCKVTLLEENAAIYAWSNNEAAAVTPGTPTVYDPLNNPLLQLVNSTTGALADGNRLRFSRCESGIRGYSILLNSGSLPIGIAKAVDAGSGKAYISTTGSFTAASQSVALGTDVASDYQIPVTPGEHIFVGGQLAVSFPAGSTWTLYCGFLNAAGSTLTPAALVAASVGLTFPSAQGNFADVPAGAVRAFPYVQVTSGTTGSFSIVLSEMMLCSAGNFQTLPPAFSPGPSNEYAADVTGSVVGPNASNVLYDNAGTTFQSADDLVYKVQTATGTQTSGVTLAYRVIDGTFNGLNSGSAPTALTLTGGVGTITPTALTTDTAILEITAALNGRTLPVFTTKLTKQLAAPAPTGTGGGGGSSSDVPSQSSGFTPITTSSFATISQSLTFTMPTGKTQLNCAVNLAPKWSVNNANQAGPWNIESKVVRGGVDQGSLQNSNPDPYQDTPLDVTRNHAGTLQYTIPMTGLTPGVQYTIIVQARISTGTIPTSGGSMVFSGTVTLSAP